MILHGNGLDGNYKEILTEILYELVGENMSLNFVIPEYEFRRRPE